MATLTATMLTFNVAINFTLIPPLGIAGAAGAMLATEVLFTAWISRLALRMVGGIGWLTTVSSALAAGIAMTAICLPLHDSLPAALAAGSGAYLIVLLLVERHLNPLDVAFVTRMARRRLPSRPFT
jgi:O-antigen/teichoic acid export membrane protein